MRKYVVITAMSFIVGIFAIMSAVAVINVLHTEDKKVEVSEREDSVHIEGVVPEEEETEPVIESVSEGEQEPEEEVKQDLTPDDQEWYTHHDQEVQSDEGVYITGLEFLPPMDYNAFIADTVPMFEAEDVKDIKAIDCYDQVSENVFMFMVLGEEPQLQIDITPYLMEYDEWEERYGDY